MASISRCVAKDCKLQSSDAFQRTSCDLSVRRGFASNLSLRSGIALPEARIRSLAIHDKSRSPVLAVSAPSLFKDASMSRIARLHCNAATNVPGDLPSGTPSGMSQYERIIETLTTLFPVWVILGTIIGIYKPSAVNSPFSHYNVFVDVIDTCPLTHVSMQVTWLETDLFTVGLGFLMLSMGLTLTFEDFRRCLRNPWTVGVGFLAQYLIKPMLGFFIAMLSLLFTFDPG